VPIVQDQRGGYPLRVIDPTCGSTRLLAPFAQGDHKALGIELDDRLVPIARRAVGRGNVRKGDVYTYAPAIPRQQWDVAVINPPSQACTDFAGLEVSRRTASAATGRSTRTSLARYWIRRATDAAPRSAEAQTGYCVQQSDDGQGYDSGDR
jgi:predicted RNA methylase